MNHIIQNMSLTFSFSLVFMFMFFKATSTILDQTTLHFQNAKKRQIGC